MRKDIIKKVVENRQHETANYIYRLCSRIEEDGQHYFITKERKGQESVKPETVLDDLSEEYWKYLPESSDSLTEEAEGTGETMKKKEAPSLPETEEKSNTQYENEFSQLDEYALVMRTCEAIEDMGKKFLEVSALLYIAKQRIDNGEFVMVNGMYTNGSVTDIYTYGKENFGFSRGTVSDYVNIAERFLCFTPIGEGKTVIVPQLRYDYEDYSVSQLQAILPIKDETFIKENIGSEMTVREIKSLVKKWKSNGNLFDTDNEEKEDTLTGSPRQRASLPANREPPLEGQPFNEQSGLVQYKFTQSGKYATQMEVLSGLIEEFLKVGKDVMIFISPAVAKA